MTKAISITVKIDQLEFRMTRDGLEFKVEGGEWDTPDMDYLDLSEEDNLKYIAAFEALESLEAWAWGVGNRAKERANG